MDAVRMATVPHTAIDLPQGIAARLRAAPTTDFLYSSLSFLRGRFGNAVPGTWFVAALGEIGVDPQAVRQALFRMVRSGALVTRRAGRVNWYQPTPTTVAILDAGGARTREAINDSWDGQWTLVHLRLADRERQARDRLRDVLLVHGFGRLRSGVYVHPGDKVKLVLDAAAGIGLCCHRLGRARCPRTWRAAQKHTSAESAAVRERDCRASWRLARFMNCSGVAAEAH